MNDSEHEQQFLSAPENDRLMAFSMALATELWVTRARLHRLEGMLQASGHLSDGALDNAPDDAERAAMQPDLERFVSGLMATLKGKQASVPAGDDILQSFV